MRILRAVLIFIIAFEFVSCDDSDVTPHRVCKLESETRYYYRTSTEDTVITELNYEYDSISRVKRQGSKIFTYYGDTLVISNNDGFIVEHRFENGRIVSVTDGGRNFNNHWFEYDSQGNLVKRISLNYRGYMTEYLITMENGNIVKIEWMDDDVHKTVQELHYDQGKNPKKGMVTELFGDSWRDYFNTNNWILNVVDSDTSSLLNNSYDNLGNLIEKASIPVYWETYRYLCE